MNLLVLGGTKFLGRFVVDEALKRGHEVSIFNRGKTNPNLFPMVEKLCGDRDGEIVSLKGRKWDAIIDTCGYYPRVVKDSATLLSASCNVYMFVSSISVYKDFSKPGVSEEDDVITIENEQTEEITGETYGALKALCENEVKKAFPEGHVIIRPGLIVGPYDPTDRFTYWLRRIGKGGDVVAPEHPDASIQIIDVRDLASFMLGQLENKSVGTFNVTGPKEVLNLEEFLNTTKELINPKTSITWIKDEFLTKNGVQYWTDIPLYIPKGKDMDGFLNVNIEKALQAGLTTRPITETIKDTYDWSVSEVPYDQLKAGMKENQEREILTKCVN
jgi:2'-hydroxyisoflavone reductase